MNDVPRTSSSGGHQVQITMQGLAKSLGTVGGLLTTFVLVQPWTLYYLGLLKTPLLLLALLTTVFFALVALERRHGRKPPWVAPFDPTHTRTISLLVAASIVASALLITWSQPTRQQIAQQILNDRGMFLRRLYYKTALEVANTNGVALFHDAGFSPPLAFELLGEQAETVPDQQSVDVLLSLSEAELADLLPVVAVPRGSEPGYELVDNLIRYRTSDAGATMPGRITPSAAPPQLDNPLEELLFATGLPLLGHAALNKNTEAIDLLLALGADARLATLRLASVGELPTALNLLAVDPFLFVADRVLRNRMSSDEAITLLTAMHAAGLAPSTHAMEAIATLGHEPRSRKRKCDADQTSASPGRFLGYRQDTDGENWLGEFVPTHLIGCGRYVRHFDGELHFDNGYTAPALLTTATATGRAAGLRLAALTIADDSEERTEWAHFVGDITPSGAGFTTYRRGVELSFAASNRSLDAVRTALSPTPDAREVDCAVPEIVLGEQPILLRCPRLGDIEWDIGAEPMLLALTDVETGERRLMLSTASERFSLRSGTYRATALPLSTAATELDVAYVVRQPQVSPVAGSAVTADWPTEAFRIRDSISSGAEQFVRLQLAEYSQVILSLTALESDVDLFLTSDEDSYIDFASTAGGTDSEEISELLPTGLYMVRLQAFGEDSEQSPYTLTLSSNEPRLRGRMEAINGREPQRVNIEAVALEGDLFSFPVRAQTTVVISVEPVKTDIDVVLLDEDGQPVDESSNGSVETERIEHTVNAGTYYVKVFPYDNAEDKPGEYTLTVEDANR